ncbi:hypothetical protein Q9966_000505 [Columba livia]|nr:hypothetical protein Q9966_000505 [Columba livia]
MHSPCLPTPGTPLTLPSANSAHYNEWHFKLCRCWERDKNYLPIGRYRNIPLFLILYSFSQSFPSPFSRTTQRREGTMCSELEGKDRGQKYSP